MITKDSIYLANIEEELCKLWLKLEEKEQTRACLFTLVIYTEASPRQKLFEDLVSTIIQQYPCRVLFITLNTDSQTDILTSSVSAEAVPHSHYNVCCEVIRIHLSEKYLQRLPSIILPHLIPDLPVHLLWGQNPCSTQPLLSLLEGFATRLIFDSCIAQDLPHFAQAVLKYDIDNTIDVNWERSSEWRDVLAKSFSDEEKYQQLAKAPLIEIFYNIKKSSPSVNPSVRATYLATWLCTQLKWKIQTFSSYGITHSQGILLFRPQLRQEYGPETVFSICITAQDKSLYRFCLNSSLRQVQVDVETPKQCYIPHTLALSSLKHNQSLCQKILYTTPQPPYATMLENLAHAKKHKNLIVLGNYEESIQHYTQMFLDLAKSCIEEFGSFSVALAGGSTPKAVYQMLAHEKHAKSIDWTRVLVFFGDERDVPPEHPDSNYKMAMDAAFSKLPLPKENIFRMRAEEDIEKNALRYEALLKEKLPSSQLDLVLLGMGEDGHTASLFPHTDALHIQDRLVSSTFVPQKNCSRMTLTYPCINQAKNIHILVLGENKAAPLDLVWNSPPDFQTYPIQNITGSDKPPLWILDQAAGKSYTTSQDTASS